jgi:hypothetical protein
MDLLAFSGCFWLLYGLYVSIRIERFIVKRYETETDILETVFFKEHATFTRYIPDFFSSAMYTSHLLMLLWGWRIYRSKKMYRDIEDPQTIIRHFSAKEIRLVKCFAISCVIISVHALIFYSVKWFFPAMFG